MKRAAIVVAVLGMSVSFWQSSFAQSNDKPAGQNAPAAQATGQAPGQAAAPAGKRKPMAKTQEEFAAYNAAVALTDPTAQEKAALLAEVVVEDDKTRLVAIQAWRSASCTPDSSPLKTPR